jgi:hypothetical protein
VGWWSKSISLHYIENIEDPCGNQDAAQNNNHYGCCSKGDNQLTHQPGYDHAAKASANEKKARYFP